jgi:glycosyltransferase involved in cell wall biosynthesis
MRVVFYCGQNFVQWGPQSLYSGIGGSEEAAIHMSRALVLLGCDVTVYADLAPGARGMHDGVRWLSYVAFGEEPPGDVFIAWRHSEHLALSEGWRQVHHWLHNRQEFPYPPEAAARVDRLLLVSRHHGTDTGFATLDPAKIHYTSNALDAGFLREPGRNEPHRAIYASCPARGLQHVLEMWPAVRRAVPGATLDVYHGFTPVYDAMSLHYPKLHEVKETILRLVDQEGVEFHGMVGQDRLADAFARAGVWLYPTDTPETSCVTAMKALAMGCLPVTSGFAVLGETLGGRDLGPVHDRPISESRWRLRLFRRRTIRAMKLGGTPKMMAKRLEWAHWARQRYDWRDVARDWMDLFLRIEREKPGAVECPPLLVAGGQAG